ncbi:MAG TPA: hypothetical protein VHC69_07010 [Polyangiaceae bacterium]|nr:hypothetical protein [Polyangiaceae bacterium]
MHDRAVRALLTAFALLAVTRLAHAAPVPPAPSTVAPAATAPPSPAGAALAPETGNPSDLPARPPARPTGLGDVPIETAAPVRRGAFVHDGLFARASVGPGLFQASSGHSPDTRTFSGGTVSFDAAVGGSPVRGFIMGAEWQTNRVFSLSSTDAVIDGDEPDLSGVSFSVSSIALFVDFYPDPTDGLHFLGAVGVGWLDVNHSNSGDTPSPTGPLLSLGVGYEWFVGPEISLGLLARGNLGLFSVNETGSSTSTGVTAFVPVLLATATYN